MVLIVALQTLRWVSKRCTPLVSSRYTKRGGKAEMALGFSTHRANVRMDSVTRSKLVTYSEPQAFWMFFFFFPNHAVAAGFCTVIIKKKTTVIHVTHQKQARTRSTLNENTFQRETPASTMVNRDARQIMTWPISHSISYLSPPSHPTPHTSIGW